jgi:hypothetical protein
VHQLDVFYIVVSGKPCNPDVLLVFIQPAFHSQNPLKKAKHLSRAIEQPVVFLGDKGFVVDSHNYTPDKYTKNIENTTYIIISVSP